MVRKKPSAFYYFGDVMDEIGQATVHAGVQLYPSRDLYEPGDVLPFGCIEPGQATELGMAEVVSVKRCALLDVDEFDLDRMKGDFKSVDVILELLRRANPDGQLSLRTEVEVVTLRIIEHDLAPIIQYYQKHGTGAAPA